MNTRKSENFPARLAAVGVWTVAVILVAGGAATAANLINGKRIKPGTVSSKQIKDRGVARKDLARNAVGTGQLAGASVTAAKLAPGVVTAGPQGATGPTGAAGPAGADGLSKADAFGSEPNFLVGTGGGSVIVSDLFVDLAPGGLAIDGLLELYAESGAPNTVTCTLSATFVDASDAQVGSQVNLASPATTLAADGQRATIPLTGALDASSPPAGAVRVELRVICAATSTGTSVSEVRLNAIALDELSTP